MVPEKEKRPDRLDSAMERMLSDSDFGLPDVRKFPMPDVAPVRAEEAYFRDAPEDLKSELVRNIIAKAHEFGVNIKSLAIDSSSGAILCINIAFLGHCMLC